MTIFESDTLTFLFIAAVFLLIGLALFADKIRAFIDKIKKRKLW